MAKIQKLPRALLLWVSIYIVNFESQKIKYFWTLGCLMHSASAVSV